MTKQPKAREPDQPLALSSSAVLGATGIDLDMAQPPEGQQLTDISAP